MTILLCNPDRTTLNTGFSTAKFSRTANLLDLNEYGFKAEALTPESPFSFKKWKFNSTREENDSIYFDADPFEGLSFLEIIEGTDRALKARAVYACFQCITQALMQNIDLKSVGAGGILYNEKFNSKTKTYSPQFLFMPADIFEQCAMNYGEDSYCHLQGFWQNKNLNGSSALLFTKACILYKALSGYYPFSSINTHDRQEDITDRHFIPLEDRINGINKDLSCNIGWALSIDSAQPHKDDSVNAEILKQELGLKEDGSYSEPLRPEKLDQKEFEHKTSNRKKASDAKIRRKRTFRKNAAAIIITLAFFAVATNLSYKRHLESLEKPSTVGLGQFDVIQTFFSGMHGLNAPLMQLSAKGPKVQGTIDMVSNVHVTSQTRNAYSTKEATLSPELWFYRSELMNNWIFGITDFTIDGESACNYYLPPAKKYKLKPFVFEDGQKVPAGFKTTHDISYNLVYSSGLETPITVDKCTAKVTCTFSNSRWYVTDLEVEHDTKDYDKDKVILDYQNEKALNSDPVIVVKNLKNKYTWLPDNASMKKAEQEAYEQAHYFD